MRNGDSYIKWNGEEFIYLGTSIPLKGINNEEKPTKLFKCGSARIEETNKHMPIYDVDKNPLIDYEEDKPFYTDSENPYVLYRHAENKKMWISDIEVFNGVVNKGKCKGLKRYTQQLNIFSF